MSNRRVLTAISVSAALGLLAPLLNVDVQGSVSKGSSPSVGVRAADFNMYGVNNDFGLVGQHVDTPGLEENAHFMMRQAGVGWVRYWLSWQIVQPTNDPNPANWNWAAADNDINAAISQGLNVYVSLRGAPAWPHGGKNTYGWGGCGTGPDGDHPFDPSKVGCTPGDLPPFDPPANGLEQSYNWKRFVTEAVKRYGDRVKYWGFWNEPSDQWHWPQWDTGCFDSRLKSLIDKVILPGRQAALAVSPSIQIVGPDDFNSSKLQFFLQAEQSGVCGSAPYGQLFDVISHHIYNIHSNENWLQEVRDVLANYPRREFWLTETNADGSIAAQLDRIQPRGWISKVFVYRIKVAACEGLGLLLMNEQPCGQYWTYTNHILANKPSMHFAGTTGAVGYHDFLLLQNPNTSATTADIQFSMPNGTSKVFSWTLGGLTRNTFHIPTLGYAGVDQAVTVRSTSPSLPLWAEHAAYSNYGADGAEAGRVTQGTGERSDTWYFAEGVVGSFWTHENTVYNPSSAYWVNVTWTFLGQPGSSPRTVVRSLPPLGSAKINVNQEVQGSGQTEQSTKVTGAYASGPYINEPAAVVAERTITWGGGWDSHSTRGVPFLSHNWYFAEGSTASGWSTFVLLLNPSAQTATVQVQYMTPSGWSAATNYTVPPNSRITVSPSGLGGEIGVAVRSIGANAPAIAAERAMYGNGMTIGTATEGAPVPSQRWMFAEGTTEGGRYYDTYLLLANPSGSHAQTRLKFRPQTGSPVDAVVTLLPGQRQTFSVWDQIPALRNVPFSTEVIVEPTGAVPVPPGIVAERSMYWRGSNGWGGMFAGHSSMGMP